jgi:hypothetical protein
MLILSPQRCDEVNERLRAMALDDDDDDDDDDEEGEDEDEDEGTLRTPIEAIDAMDMAFEGL